MSPATPRVLVCHNHYLIPGGEDESFRQETELLRANGHHVETYVEDNRRIAEQGQRRTAVQTLFSMHSYKQLRERIRLGGHDLVYVQNFFPLISPAVYYAAHAEGVPVVQTLRNYRLFCSNAYFYRDNHVCEDCLGKAIPWPALLHACYRDSRPGTAVLATMQVGHRVAGTWGKRVDRYIALTEFARQKYIQGGLPAEKLTIKPNFLSSDPGLGKGDGGYALFVGRLSPEKGVETMVEAWRQIGTALPLKIVGEGPQAEELAASIAGVPGVELLGPRGRAEVTSLMQRASILVFPSRWYEGFPRVILEAFAVGLPVVASRLGGMAELVEHGRTGCHFSPGDAGELAAQVRALLADPTRTARMREACRREYETKYTAQRNYAMLASIFAELLEKPATR